MEFPLSQRFSQLNVANFEKGKSPLGQGGQQKTFLGRICRLNCA
jgi:hypothetical protein